MATIAGPGDAVILPLPYYFNHKMWLDMAGVATQLLPTGDDLMPDPGRAASLITPQTRAIVLVSPNNPGGVAYPPALIRAFFELARARGLALIVDETYRDYLDSDGAPHDLFADPDWDDTLVHLYSFSKAYRLTGHRVGALMASEARLAEVEKFLDTVAICPPQVGQIGALWGMRNLSDWLAGRTGRDPGAPRRDGGGVPAAARAGSFWAAAPISPMRATRSTRPPTWWRGTLSTAPIS
jgi:aspartate/methionine/tyrosine aminotransferase